MPDGLHTRRRPGTTRPRCHHVSSRKHGTPREKNLTAQAQSALDAVTEQDRSMVESGVERVSDGVHTQPDLPAGHSCKLTVVCAGKGAAQIVFTPSTTAAKKAVPCDGSAVFERFTSGKGVRIDVQGGARATGTIAWRINTI
ncbi:hypothetical protein ACFQ3Z_08565 [Streptomyces nogalater]